MRNLCLTTVLLLLVGLTTAGNAAQEFMLDVVSVREGGGGPPQPRPFRPGRMVLPNREMEWLVRFAFALYQPSFGPGAIDQQVEGWPDRDLPRRRFTLEATYSGTSTPPLVEQRRLVREILEDRFGMRAHVEQREQPVHALRLRKPSVLGPGIREVDYDCTDPETRARSGAETCRQGDRLEESGIFYRGSGPIAVLVSRLQMELRDRVVVDRTGLDGFYEWELLRMERSQVPRPLSELIRPLPELLPVQLGMTLEDTRAPVDIVVIGAISLPTPN
jgi:uncharacterized protein (TIGR03435 family)